jgi:hypothetical protein
MVSDAGLFCIFAFESVMLLLPHSDQLKSFSLYPSTKQKKIDGVIQKDETWSYMLYLSEEPLEVRYGIDADCSFVKMGNSTWTTMHDPKISHNNVEAMNSLYAARKDKDHQKLIKPYGENVPHNVIHPQVAAYGEAIYIDTFEPLRICAPSTQLLMHADY